jgi:hypothetical protein
VYTLTLEQYDILDMVEMPEGIKVLVMQTYAILASGEKVPEMRIQIAMMPGTQDWLRTALAGAASSIVIPEVRFKI